MQKSTPVDWVTAYTAHNLPEAYLVAGRLENAGIINFIKPDSVGQIYGFTVGRHSGVEVLVNEADYERAEAVLRQIQ